MLKSLSYLICIIFFLTAFSLTLLAEDIEIDPVLKEKIALIEESKQLLAENQNYSNSAVSFYLSNYHSGETEFNPGGKYERDIFSRVSANNMNLRYVLEGIYLDGEDKNIAAFLSIKFTLEENLFTPYFGVGAEFMGKADYQAFVGLNLNKNFFVETKFINDRNKLESGDFYSVFGFTINL